jgi:hypothetical protein
MEPVLHSYSTLRGTVNEVENEKKTNQSLHVPSTGLCILFLTVLDVYCALKKQKIMARLVVRRICSSALCQLIMSAKGTVTVPGVAAPDHPRKLPHGHATRSSPRAL